MSNELVKFLEWDTHFFDRRIASITVNQLTFDTYEQIKLWCINENIDCLYFLADSADANTIHIAEDNGFNFVDTRVVYKKTIDPVHDVPNKIREDIVLQTATEDDIETLVGMSNHIFQPTRFYNDRNFSEEKVNEFYQIWIHNSIKTEFADETMLVRLDGEIVAYFIIKYHNPANEGNYSLLYVSPKTRGLGIATYLLATADRHFLDNGMHVANVVTQGTNIAAQRLYQKTNMLLSSFHYWYHKWFTKP